MPPAIQFGHSDWIGYGFVDGQWIESIEWKDNEWSFATLPERTAGSKLLAGGVTPAIDASAEREVDRPPQAWESRPHENGTLSALKIVTVSRIANPPRPRGFRSVARLARASRRSCRRGSGHLRHSTPPKSGVVAAPRHERSNPRVRPGVGSAFERTASFRNRGRRVGTARPSHTGSGPRTWGAPRSIGLAWR